MGSRGPHLPVLSGLVQHTGNITCSACRAIKSLEGSQPRLTLAWSQHYRVTGGVSLRPVRRYRGGKLLLP